MTGQRSLTSRGRARQQALVAAAADLFLAKGFAAVTVDEIVAAAGGSKTNVYRQFGGKEGLFIEVVEVLSAEFLSPLVQLDLGRTGRAAGLEILGRTLLRQLLEPRHIAFQRMILASSDLFPGLMARWLETGPRQSQAIISRFLGPGAESGRLALFFHDMIVTDPVLRAMMGETPPWDEIEAQIDAAAAMVARLLPQD
ncbi:TetR/AcrR family transcriptional regulator [Poseidonocella sp. HB161398]|uniref:TetR/AcrR family transcriptional regulator n=1 Tax=Poseidonocella sp. HB161398 TaxID=2320855 RepID=UPI0011098227|nr:TetR/AcrR family transcriptional regulator [Poseidonocella sp. HB161398]